MPPLSWAVFIPNTVVAKARSLSTTITTLTPDSFDSDQIEVDAIVTGAPFVDAKFMYRVGSGQWKNLGIDSAPTFSFNPKQSGLYRIFPLVKTFPKKSSVQFKTVATDSYGVTATSAIKTLRTK